MRHYWAQADFVPTTPEERIYRERMLDKAQAAAEKAAPFIHPKLASTEVSGAGGGPISVIISQADAAL